MICEWQLDKATGFVPLDLLLLSKERSPQGAATVLHKRTSPVMLLFSFKNVDLQAS